MTTCDDHQGSQCVLASVGVGVCPSANLAGQTSRFPAPDGDSAKVAVAVSQGAALSFLSSGAHFLLALRGDCHSLLIAPSSGFPIDLVL
jgi:hypothetical protein